MAKDKDGKPAKKTGKAAGAGGSRKGTAARAAASEKRLLLEEELQEAIAQIDEEGLTFLLSQAHVLIHNAQVQRINEELAVLDRKNRAARKAMSAAGAAPAGDSAGEAGVARVGIEGSPDGKATFLSLGGTRKVLALDELKRLVRICYSADSKSAALHQLFRLLSRDRNDILVDAKIGGPSSPLIEGLFYALREKYRLEDR